MTPAEQRVLDAARAYRDASQLPGNWPGLAEGRRLFEAARALPHTLPPPVVTDNPAEVVQGEVRERWGRQYTVARFAPEGRVRPTAQWFSTLAEITADRLVSRPGVDL